MTRTFIIFNIVLLMIFATASTFASQPPGLDKQNKTPDGFSQGQKKGWDSNRPPGWDKSKKNNVKNNELKEIETDDLEIDCDDIADGQLDERCSKGKKNKKIIKKENSKGKIKKEIK